MSKTHFPIALALAGALLVSACSSSDKKAAVDPAPATPPAPPVHTVDLMGSRDLGEGETTIAAGQEVTVGDTTVSCPAGGADCILSVTKDPVTGQQSATSTGGAAMVAYTAAEPEPKPDAPTTVSVPPGNSLQAALRNTEQRTLVIQPGSFVDYANVRWSCPAGGSTCVVQFSDDINPTATTGGAGSGTATAGQIPPATNPAFGGGSSLAYLSAQNLLDALGNGANITGGLDRTGDGFNNAAIRQSGGSAVQLTAFASTGGSSAYPGAALALGGGVAMDLYTGAAAATQSPFTTAIGAFVTPTLDADFWSALTTNAGTGSYAAGSTLVTSDGQTAATSTYQGAAGTLSCQTGVCSITAVVGGSTSGEGAWRFTPATNATVNVPDPDYLTFGWWRQQQGLAAAQTDVVWAGSDPYRTSNLAALTGTATYNGGSVGHFEQRTAQQTTVNSGTFRATATVTADFDNDLINGSLTGVAEDGGTSFLPNGVAVSLNNASLSAATFNGSATILLNNVAQTTSGTFNGALFGNGAATQLVPSAPTGVAGEFAAFTGTRGMATGETGTASAYLNLQGAFAAD